MKYMKPIKIPATINYPKILLITALRIGDTLFCIPGIHFLKKNLPQVQLDVLVISKSASELFANNPYIGDIYVISDAKKIRKLAAKYPLIIKLMPESTKYLKHVKNNLISIGKLSLNKPRMDQIIEFLATLLENPKFDSEYEYPLYPQQQDIDNVMRLLLEQGVNFRQEILVGFHLGCHRIARRGWKFWNRKRHRHKKVWPIENYIELAHRLNNNISNVKIILTGSSKERYLARKFLVKFPKAISMISRTTLLETAALMDLLKVYVTNDTGTLHIACARQTPLVALYLTSYLGFARPQPMRPQYTVIDKERIEDITVGQVYSAVINQLEKL